MQYSIFLLFRILKRALKSVCKSNSKSITDTDIVFVYLQGTDYVSYEKRSLISRNSEKYFLAD